MIMPKCWPQRTTIWTTRRQTEPEVSFSWEGLATWMAKGCSMDCDLMTFAGATSERAEMATYLTYMDGSLFQYCIP